MHLRLPSSVSFASVDIQYQTILFHHTVRVHHQQIHPPLLLTIACMCTQGFLISSRSNLLYRLTIRFTFDVHLEDHLVRLVAISQTELGGEVSLHHGGGLDGLDDGGIDLLLVGLALVGDDGGLGGVALEEFLLTLAVGGGGAGKVGIVEGGNVDAGDIDLGGGGDHVGLVDPTEGDTVDLVRAGDEEEAGLERLEADDALAAEATSEKDEDGAGGDGGADLGCLLVILAGGEGTLDIVGGVEAGGLAGGGGSLLGLLGTSSSEYSLLCIKWGRGNVGIHAISNRLFRFQNGAKSIDRSRSSQRRAHSIETD